jgi:hypothetical protein
MIIMILNIYYIYFLKINKHIITRVYYINHHIEHVTLK